jgi:hypothetical protein
MTEYEKQVKILTAQICAYTAACCVDDYLQESGYVSEELKKKPSKIIQDLLVSKVKLEACINKLMPDFTAKQSDFTNQVSYILEDVIKEMYDKITSNRIGSKNVIPDKN